MRDVDEQRWIQPLICYGAAWNCQDPEERLELLRQAVTDDCGYTDPEHDVTGPQQLSDMIAGYHRRWPAEYAIELTSIVEQIFDCLRFTWRAHGRDAEGDPTEQRGADTIEIAEDGLLRRIIVFDGDLPARPPS